VTSHELARLLLEEPEVTIVTVDGTGYREASSVFPIKLLQDWSGGEGFEGNWRVPQRGDEEKFYARVVLVIT
jgi:hypothetical protein